MSVNQGKRPAWCPPRTSLLLLCVLALPSCSGLRTAEPGGTVLTHTAVGAGAGALIGWAAGGAGTGAAIGAGVGLLAGAVEATRQSEERKRAEVRVVEYRDRPIAGSKETRREKALSLVAAARRVRNADDAIDLLRHSITTYPTPEAHDALGSVFFREGRTEQAVREWRQALVLDPNYQPAIDHLNMVGSRP